MKWIVLYGPMVFELVRLRNSINGFTTKWNLVERSSTQMTKKILERYMKFESRFSKTFQQFMRAGFLSFKP